jgi:plastocyanin
MRIVLIATLVMAIGGCHLADSPETNCQPGSHPSSGICVQDDIKATAIVIGGSPCGVDPDPFHVTSGQTFQFVNHDATDHEVKGADGQVWATVAQGQSSNFYQIVKKGSWDYTVSGCKGGTVVVE